MNKPADNGRKVWCWCREAHDERWEGPFESRADAIAEGLAETDGDFVIVGTGTYHDAGSYADLTELHERINEMCIDDDVWTDDCGDDPFTLVGDKTEAQSEFDAFCRKWFAPHQFTVNGDAETVYRDNWKSATPGDDE